jgi:hypothetical protein
MPADLLAPLSLQLGRTVVSLQHRAGASTLTINAPGLRGEHGSNGWRLHMLEGATWEVIEALHEFAEKALAARQWAARR